MKITNYNLVLGSNSPRRKEILTEMGLSSYINIVGFPSQRLFEKIRLF